LAPSSEMIVADCEKRMKREVLRVGCTWREGADAGLTSRLVLRHERPTLAFCKSRLTFVRLPNNWQKMRECKSLRTAVAATWRVGQINSALQQAAHGYTRAGCTANWHATSTWQGGPPAGRTCGAAMRAEPVTVRLVTRQRLTTDENL
jgi:hypothetical protein